MASNSIRSREQQTEVTPAMRSAWDRLWKLLLTTPEDEPAYSGLEKQGGKGEPSERKR